MSFSKPKKPKTPPPPATFGDPVVREAEDTLKLNQRPGYGGNVYAGASSQAQQNRAKLAAALGNRGGSTPMPATAGNTYVKPTLPPIERRALNALGF